MNGFKPDEQPQTGCGERLRYRIADPSECSLAEGCYPANVEACREKSLCVGAAVLYAISDLEPAGKEIEG